MTSVTFATIGLFMLAQSAQPTGKTAEQTFDAVHAAYLAAYEPLVIEAGKAWWEASISGEKSAFDRREKADNKLIELHSDTETFKTLQKLRDENRITDPIKRRMLDVMYREFLPAQADADLQKRIVASETEIERIFNTHRGEVDGKEVSENDVRDILATTKDTEKAKQAWVGFTSVSRKVADKLRETVRMRNELAKKLGYDDFYEMKLDVQEIDEAELLRVFDELDVLTRDAFAELKSDIDKQRADHFGIDVKDLRPWHMGDIFFQEAPPLGGADLDEVYASQDLLALTKAYYEGMGLEVAGILGRSDLYEKPGKSSHAFATDIDRAGDERVLCNLKPNLRWADTLIHELGHAVYDQYIDRKLPFILRTPSHSITTEGYAMMMGAKAKNPELLTKVVGLSESDAAKYVQAARESIRAEKLIFSRWAQVMVRFEHGMYNNPEQDLAKLWWDLKKKYQLVNPPDDATLPGYAAKIHVVTVPVYYHSYMLGDLFASQVNDTIAHRVIKTNDVRDTAFVGSTAAGEFMRKEIFAPGNLYNWRDLTKRITGKAISPECFVQQYIKK
ncbi:MAG: M2 family metallopeptidase [Phycisphaerales bacterium]|nr:M2 family metallopeptidase [Phycisphaerales bacterium]